MNRSATPLHCGSRHSWGRWSCPATSPLGSRNRVRFKSSLKDEKEIRENDDKIKEAERKIENANKERGPLEKEVSESRRMMISDRFELNKLCRDARKSVMEVFAAAKEKVNSETEENIKPLAKRLSDGYQKNEPGHETAIKERDKAREI